MEKERLERLERERLEREKWERERPERERKERKEREDNMPNFNQQVASGNHYDKIKSIGVSHSDLKKIANGHFKKYGSMDKSTFKIGYQNNKIIPFGEISWKESDGNKYFAIGQINESDLNLKNNASSNELLEVYGLWDRIHNTPGVKIMIYKRANGHCEICEYRGNGTGNRYS